MKIVNTATMMALDRRTIHELGLPSLVLMERAALGMCAAIQSHFSQLKTVHLLVGTGNNGGDGLALARLLHCQGVGVQVWLQGKPEKRSPDNQTQFEINQKLGLEMHLLSGPEQQAALAAALPGASLIVDALFGVGLARDITGSWADLIQLANAAAAPKVALDIPSGIHADTGQVLGTAFRADLTLTCALPKWGHLLDLALDWVGVLERVDIGIPPQFYADHPEAVLEPTLLRAWKPGPRRRNAHKGSFGRLGLVAGSLGMAGAARLAASAALETGVGLVFLFVPASIQAQLATALPEVQVVPLSESQAHLAPESLPLLQTRLAEMDTVLLGPGLGRHTQTGQVLRALVQGWQQQDSPPSLVLDADALYPLPQVLGGAALQLPAILTPHPGELARLLDLSGAEVQAHRVRAVRQAVECYGAVTVLKGARSLIASPNGTIWFNPGGNPGMARGGMGDVLAGLCAGLLAQGLPPEQAAALGVYWHSLAADQVAQDCGETSLTVLRLLEALPQAWRRF